MTNIRYRLARAVWAPQFWRRMQTAWHLCEAIDLNRASPFFITIRITSTLSTLSTSSTSTFSTLLRFLSKFQRLTISSVWRGSCLYRTCRNVMQERGGAMSLVFIFRRWNKWYRVLRYRKGFGLLDSVRYGLWLAHS
jgi:hypothetical protein